MSKANCRSVITGTIEGATLGLLALAVGAYALAADVTAEAPLALGGLDPVRLIAGERVAGRADLTATQAGLTFRFADETSRERFESDPERFGVQLDGRCVMAAGMAGDPSLFTVVEGRIYLGGARMCMDAFEAQPASFVDVATGRRATPPEQTEPRPPRKRVAILVFEGVQIIDYTGPYEVFGQAGYEVFTVAEKPDMLTTAMGMQVKPAYTFADAPRADVIVFPGGDVQDENPVIREWIVKTVPATEHVLTVCNGAFYLGRAGLLDGLQATTFYGLIDALRTAAPQAEVVTDRRFVDNGRIVTTAGLSSGIDGALYMVSRISGFGRAQAVALNMEYDWKPDSTYARASFADAPLRALRDLQSFDLTAEQARNWTFLGQDGDARSWEKRWQFESDASPEAIRESVESAIARRWTRDGQAGGRGLASSWRFEDRDGAAWTARSSLEPAASGHGAYVLRVAVTRAPATAAAALR